MSIISKLVSELSIYGKFSSKAKIIQRKAFTLFLELRTVQMTHTSLNLPKNSQSCKRCLENMGWRKFSVRKPY